MPQYIVSRLVKKLAQLLISLGLVQLHIILAELYFSALCLNRRYRQNNVTAIYKSFIELQFLILVQNIRSTMFLFCLVFIDISVLTVFKILV